VTGQVILHTMPEFLCRCRGFEHVTSTSWPAARWPIRLTLGLKRCTRRDQKCGRCVSWVHSLEIRGNTNARWTLTRNSTLQSYSSSKVRVCIPHDTVLMVGYMSTVWDAWPKMGSNSILIKYVNKGKGTAIPWQAWIGPEGSRRLRLPDFKTVGTWKW